MGFGFELLAAGFGELVIAGAAVVLRWAPAGLYPAAPFGAVPGGGGGALLSAEGPAGRLVEPLGEGPSRRGFKGEGAKDEEIEGALGEIDARHGSLLLLQEGYRRSCRNARGKPGWTQGTPNYRGIYRGSDRIPPCEE